VTVQTPPWVQYQALIETYFPPDQWINASCILEAETLAWSLICGTTSPESCVVDLGSLACYSDQTAQPAQAYGLYKIVDVCWNPALARNHTPFTAAEWANILDPVYNVWAASVIWSISGWRAWTTCATCGICGVEGGPIPYPRAPLITTGQPQPAGSTLLLPVTAVAVVGALGALAYAERVGR
jgi:hypothetical protein